jgi:hypothetical protein
MKFAFAGAELGHPVVMSCAWIGRVGAAGHRSLAQTRWPMRLATSMTVPPPAKGSTTIWPGSVYSQRRFSMICGGSFPKQLGVPASSSAVPNSLAGRLQLTRRSQHGSCRLAEEADQSLNVLGGRRQEELLPNKLHPA